MAWPSPGCALDVGSGLLLVGLGLAILLVRPRRRVNVALAAMSAGWGAAVALGNLHERADCGVLLAADLRALPALLALAGVLALALLHPEPWPRARRGALALALLPGAGYALAWLVDGGEAVWAPFRGGVVAAATLLALRVGDMPREAPSARGLVFLGTALLVEPALRMGAMASAPEWSLVTTAAGLAVCLLLAALWLRAMRNAAPDVARAARRAAWLALLLPTVGMLLHHAVDAFDGGPMGLARTLTVLLLAYGILRHQLLGIDVRVRWTISRTTVAGVFIATFFVASEAAQEFFGETTGSTYLGILTAGLLVFALAPLQRFADALAARAVPDAQPGDARAASPEALYRDLARAAWADGALSRDERALLDAAQRRLGLAPEEAMRLEQEAARAPVGETIL